VKSLEGKMKKMELEEKRRNRKREDGERTEGKEKDDRRQDTIQKVTCHAFSNVQETENHYRRTVLAAEYL
jgi:hypothetical protein